MSGSSTRSSCIGCASIRRSSIRRSSIRRSSIDRGGDSATLCEYVCILIECIHLVVPDFSLLYLCGGTCLLVRLGHPSEIVGICAVTHKVIGIGVSLHGTISLVSILRLYDLIESIVYVGVCSFSSDIGVRIVGEDI